MSNNYNIIWKDIGLAYTENLRTRNCIVSWRVRILGSSPNAEANAQRKPALKERITLQFDFVCCYWPVVFRTYRGRT